MAVMDQHLIPELVYRLPPSLTAGSGRGNGRRVSHGTIHPPLRDRVSLARSQMRSGTSMGR